MDSTSPEALPTHADELDCLRLQNAKLKADAAVRAAQDAAAAANEAVAKFEALLADAEKKYAFSDATGDVINLETHEILRKSHGD